MVSGLAGLALVLSACSGGDGEPTDNTTTPAPASAPASPSSSASASPSESDGEYVPASADGPAQNVPVPEMPEAVKEPTEEGLEAAVEYWWEANFYLRATGEPGPLDAVSTGECALCASQMERFPKVYGDDAWVVTDRAELSFQFTRIPENADSGTTSFLVSEAGGSIYLSPGEEVEESAGDGSDDRPWTAALHFDENEGHWLVDDIGTAS